MIVLGVSQGSTTLLRATLFVDLYTSVVADQAGYPTAFLLAAASSAVAAVAATRTLRPEPGPEHQGWQ